ncbi:MAG TPA: circadian clock KaiB family protein [Polyangiaceae bacterium]|nr:circadian clock KaiB family protein [Polyangiaceae bacterium]
MARAKSSTRALGHGESRERYELVLYISGTTPQSSATLQTLVAICKERLEGLYDLVVVDVYQEPARARADQIIVAPTLFKKRPLPQRRIVGDLSDRAQLLRGLGLPLDARGEP